MFSFSRIGQSLTIRVSGYSVTFLRLTRAADGRDQPNLPWTNSRGLGRFGIRHTHHGPSSRSRQGVRDGRNQHHLGNATRSQQPVRAARPSRKNVPEADVRSALATGDMGFLHSFTTGSTVDGPGVRVVAWTTGCMWRCLYCHNPDTWTMTNGIPVTVTKAAEELHSTVTD